MLQTSPSISRKCPPDWSSHMGVEEQPDTNSPSLESESLDPSLYTIGLSHLNHTGCTHVEGPVLRLEGDVGELRLGAHPVEAGEQRGEVAGELELDLVEALVALHLHAAHALAAQALAGRRAALRKERSRSGNFFACDVREATQVMDCNSFLFS